MRETQVDCIVESETSTRSIVCTHFECVHKFGSCVYVLFSTGLEMNSIW